MLTTLASMFTSVHHVLLLLFCKCASPSLNLTKARFIEKQKRKVNALRKRRTAFNIFCCRLVCWPQQYLPMNTTEDEDTTAALHCRTNVARLRRETFQNNRFHWWNKPDEPLLMMLRFQALISPTAGVDGDATETRGDCMCAHFQHRAWMVQQTCRQYTCILKKKRKRRLQLCSPVHWHRDAAVLHWRKNATSVCTESCWQWRTHFSKWTDSLPVQPSPMKWEVTRGFMLHSNNHSCINLH